MMTSFFEPVIYSCGDLGASAWVKCVQDGWGGDTPSRFVLQDPHVADRVTGLLWDRLPACVECDWSSALKLCAGRGDGWRLPNAKELMSLVDYAKGEYPYWSAVFDTSEAVPRWFWSSTPGFRSIESLAYMVDFGHGQLQGMDISSTGFGARCVRTGTQ
jgi:hypothetical protein